MTTKATSTSGVQLKRGNSDGPPETFTKIGEVTNVAGPAESAAQLDVTSFDSTSREFIAGLRDGGEVTMDMNFVGSDVAQQGIRADLAAGTKRNWKVILNDHLTTPTTIAFAAIVTAFSGPQGGVDAPVTSSATLKVSGDPVYTYAPA